MSTVATGFPSPNPALKRTASSRRLPWFVSLRKTRFIQPHVLFTGVYFLKRLFVRLWVSRWASPFGAAPVFSFFASNAPPRWHNVFSQFAPVVKQGFPVLASGSNCAVKPTRLRRAAYFRSLVPSYSASCRPPLTPALRLYPRFLLGVFGALPGFACVRLVGFRPFGPLALVQQAPPAIIFATLHPFRGPALFHGPRTSSRLGAPFWPMGLTVQSSRPAFCGRLTFGR